MHILKNFLKKSKKILKMGKKLWGKEVGEGIKRKFLWNCVSDFIERHIADIEILFRNIYYIDL